MAKQSPPKTGVARVRFIMVDAEIPDGDLSQITMAIQNALKPTVIQQRVNPQARPNALAFESSEADDERLVEDPQEDAEEVTTEPVRRARSAKPRKYASPKVIPLELFAEPSLEDFVRRHPPKTEREKNLVVAAFFKEHRGEDEVTVNHIYTCYRALNWSTSIEDFGSTL